MSSRRTIWSFAAAPGRVPALLLPLLAFTGLQTEIIEIRPVIIAVWYFVDEFGDGVHKPPGWGINIQPVTKPRLLRNDKVGKISDV